MPPDPPARYPAKPTRPLTAAMLPDTPGRRSVSGHTDEEPVDATPTCHDLFCIQPCSHMQPCPRPSRPCHAVTFQPERTVPRRRVPTADCLRNPARRLQAALVSQTTDPIMRSTRGNANFAADSYSGTSGRNARASAVFEQVIYTGTVRGKGL
ncbi:hypothetical protein Bbelb_320480 [Branchiostoma belcheri]|nr:hypothetical protein Bbelb_320480 [Branchiostoma belcheri]